MNNSPLLGIDLLGQLNAKARKEQKRQRRNKNEMGRRRNQERERQFQRAGRTGHAAEGILEILDAAAALKEYFGNSHTSSILEGHKKCDEYMDKNKHVCKACCYIHLNMYRGVWGNVSYLTYKLHAVRIIAGRSCHYVRNHPGWWAHEILYEESNAIQGIPNPINPNKTDYARVEEISLSHDCL